MKDDFLSAALEHAGFEASMCSNRSIKALVRNVSTCPYMLYFYVSFPEGPWTLVLSIGTKIIQDKITLL